MAAAANGARIESCPDWVSSGCLFDESGCVSDGRTAVVVRRSGPNIGWVNSRPAFKKENLKKQNLLSSFIKKKEKLLIKSADRYTFYLSHFVVFF